MGIEAHLTRIPLICLVPLALIGFSVTDSASRIAEDVALGMKMTFNTTEGPVDQQIEQWRRLKDDATEIGRRWSERDQEILDNLVERKRLADEATQAMPPLEQTSGDAPLTRN